MISRNLKGWDNFQQPHYSISIMITQSWKRGVGNLYDPIIHLYFAGEEKRTDDWNDTIANLLFIRKK